MWYLKVIDYVILEDVCLKEAVLSEVNISTVKSQNAALLIPAPNFVL